MIINTSQKTTTVFDVTMDAADVNELVADALRARLGVPVGYPGVTVSVDIVPDAVGAITATASIAVEASTQVSSGGDGASALAEGQSPAPATDPNAAAPLAVPPADPVSTAVAPPAADDAPMVARRALPPVAATDAAAQPAA